MKARGIHDIGIDNNLLELSLQSIGEQVVFIARKPSCISVKRLKI